MTGPYQAPENCTREQLIERLNAAEDVCLMFAWSPAQSGPNATDTENAAHELWSKWVQLPGTSADPGDHPEWSKQDIAELARRREQIRAETIARLRLRSS